MRTVDCTRIQPVRNFYKFKLKKYKEVDIKGAKVDIENKKVNIEGTKVDIRKK